MEEFVLSPVAALGTFVKIWLALSVLVYLWAFRSLLLIHTSIRMAVPWSSDYYCFVPRAATSELVDGGGDRVGSGIGDLGQGFFIPQVLSLKGKLTKRG